MSVLPVGFGSSGSYQITNSVRLRAAASAYFSRTVSVTDDRSVFTISGLFKRGKLGTVQVLAMAAGASNIYTFLAFNSADQLQFKDIYGGTTYFDYNTVGVFRDPSAWYHIVVAVNGGASAGNKVKFYVNGVEMAKAFPSDTADSTRFNLAGETFNLFRDPGVGGSPANYYDGYVAELNWVVGTFLTPSSFGETNSDGVWVPKAYTGTYGANGFHLDFSDATSLTTLGYDAAGSNDWTLNNVSLTAGVTYDWMEDTPTNNYATLNPLDKDAAHSVITNGNLSSGTGADNYHAERSTIQLPTTGKWYGESTVVAGGSNSHAIGVSTQSGDLSAFGGTPTNLWMADNQAVAGRVDLLLNGAARTAVTASAVAMLTNSVVKWAYDAATGYLWIGDGGYGYYPATLGGSVGDPAAGTNPTVMLTVGGAYFITTGGYLASASMAVNFGQRPFTYTPPTGFKALCTANLP